MAASIRPLRASIVLQEREGDAEFPASLVDAELGQRMKLDGRGYEVAQLLNRERALEELVEALGVEEAVVLRAVGLFERMHLLDTESSRAFVAQALETRAFQLENPDTAPLLIREDAAFTCTMCGSCCGGHNVGPVAADIVAGLRPMRDALIESTGTEKGLFFSVPVKHGNEVRDQVVCHSTGGSCVFLTDERRCGIHQDYGGDKKPRVCRLFPYQFVATPEGISVSLQMECRGFEEARGGKPLRDQEAGLRELLKLVPNLRRVRPVILLDGLTPLTWDGYSSLEEELHGVVDTHADNPIAVLLGMREAVERRREREEHVYPGRDVETL